MKTIDELMNSERNLRKGQKANGVIPEDAGITLTDRKTISHEKLADYDLAELIEKAEEKDVHSSIIDKVKSYADMRSLLEGASADDIAQWAYWYAGNVIEDRWPEAEPFIKQSPQYAYWYAHYVIGDRWPEAEPFIKESPQYAYWYARDDIENRWPEAEPFIKQSPQYAYFYARDVIKNRWPEAEPFIKESSKYIYFYARDVIETCLFVRPRGPKSIRL